MNIIKNPTKFIHLIFFRPKLNILAFLLLSFCSLVYTHEKLFVITDTDKLISSDLEFKKNQIELREKFPILSNNITISLKSTDENLLKNKVNEIIKELKKKIENIDFIFSPNLESFYKKYSLILMGEENRSKLISELYEKQPFLSELNNNPKIEGLNNLLELSITNIQNNEYESSKQLNMLLEKFNFSVSEKKHIKWRNFFSDEKEEFFIFFKINDQQIQEGKFDEVYKTLFEFHKASDEKLSINFTGGLVLDYEEVQSVKDGAIKAGLLSLFLVTAILLLTFKNKIFIFFILLTIIVGLSITLGLTSIFVGSLNIISVAFAVLFIGISVDFGIQFCLRYLENQSGSKKQIINTFKGIFKSLLIVSITSIIGFLSFIPTDYIGLSELGIISSFGLITGLICNLIFLPSCFILLPKTQSKNITTKKDNLYKFINFINKKDNLFLTIFAFIFILGIFFSQKITFDSDPMKLKDQKSQSVVLAQNLMEQNPSSDYTISVLLDKKNEVEKLNIKKNNIIKDIFGISDFKLDSATIEEISYLNFLLKRNDTVFYSEYNQLERLIKILNKIKNLNNPQLTDNSIKLLKNLSKINNPEKFLNLQDLWFKDYEKLVQDLDTILEIDTYKNFEEIKFPNYFKDRYISNNGLERLEIIAKQDIKQRENLLEFVSYVSQFFFSATGMPIIQFEAGNIVIKSFILAFSISLFFLITFIMIIFRNLKILFLCVIPLFFGMNLSVILMNIIKIDLNFANMIALPLLFSLGTSYSIYIVKRFIDLKSLEKLLLSSTPNAVLSSDLTTIGSFSTLSISSHYGTSSMGLLLFISLSSVLFSCLIFLPLLIKKFYKKGYL